MANRLKVFIATAEGVVQRLFSLRRLGETAEQDVAILEKLTPKDFHQGEALVLAFPEMSEGELRWSPYVFDEPPDVKAVREALDKIAVRATLLVLGETVKEDILRQLQEGPEIQGFPVPGSDRAQ